MRFYAAHCCMTTVLLMTTVPSLLAGYFSRSYLTHSSNMSKRGASFSQNMPLANLVKAGRWCLLEQTVGADVPAPHRTVDLAPCAITDKVVSLNPAHREFDPAAGLTNHRLHDGLPRSHSFDKHKNNTKRKSETTVSCVLTLFIVKCVVKPRVDFQTNSSHSFAILTGGYVSRASYSRGSVCSELCSH